MILLAAMAARPARTAASPRLALSLASFLVPVAACGGGGKHKGGATAPRTTPAAPPRKPPTADAPPAPSAPVPALPGGGERAFVSDASGLVEVSTAGGSQVVAPAAAWCSVDARANVVWYVDAGGLHAFDLTDRRSRAIIRGALGELEVIVDWGARQQLGGESELLFDVGAAIKLTGTPAIEVRMGCDGDRAVYCFENGEQENPTAAVADLQRRAGNLKLADPAYVASLARRGQQGSLWTPPPMPPPMPKKKPTVDRKQCTEDASRCGQLTAIPASPLWLVHTANSRGDYYHETRELWDPATGEYVRPGGGKLVRTKKPPAGTGGESDYRGMRVSPSGVLSHGGAVFDAAKVYYQPKVTEDDGAPVSCGWVGGGWRIAGPTDG